MHSSLTQVKHQETIDISIIHNNQITEKICNINNTTQSKPKTQDIRGSPQCGATSTNHFAFFIICLNLIFIHSCALSHRVKLRIRQEIYALSTRSSFQNQVKARRQFSIKHRALLTYIPWHKVVQATFTQLHKLLKNILKTTLLLPYIILLFILLQTLTIGPNMGKPHEPTSHNPLQKS